MAQSLPWWGRSLIAAYFGWTALPDQLKGLESEFGLCSLVCLPGLGRRGGRRSRHTCVALVILCPYCHYSRCKNCVMTLALLRRIMWCFFSRNVLLRGWYVRPLLLFANHHREAIPMPPGGGCYPLPKLNHRVCQQELVHWGLLISRLRDFICL